MNAVSTTLVKRQRQWIFGTLMFLTSGITFGQVPVDENGEPLPYSEQGSDAEVIVEAPAAVIPATDLETLVGPIALYPDDLLAIVLPASTYPLQIVQAARFLELLETNSELQPDDEWDESVIALLNYPDVIKMMNDDIDWTWKLGDAVIGQQSEVIAAVEAFRDRAYAAGNLKSDDRQTVSNDDGVIEIVPVSEEIIYVPYYEPAEVVVYQPRPVYYYHPNPYPSYYYPYPAGYRFRSNYFWGVTTAFSIGWSNHYLNVYHPTYWGHPYYGHSYNYYGHYYRHPSISVYNTWYVNNNRYSSNNYYRDGARWSPRSRAGSRPAEPRVENRHYPPGTDVRRRQSNAGRSSLDNRDNGRMNLSLRERSNADRSRIAAASRGARTQPDRLTNGQSRTDRNATSTRTRNNDAANRQRSNTNRTTAAARAEVDRSNRDRVAPNGRNRAQTRSTNDVNQGRTRTQSSNDADRGAIQFRDRGNSNRATDSRATNPTVAAATPNRNRVTNRTSQTTAARTSPNNRITTTQRTTPRAATPRPRSTAPVQQRTPAARPSNRVSSAPTRSSTPRVSAPVRSASPRSSAPQRSAPVRSAPPRSSAPARSAAPRSSAPRRSAPARSAPPRSSAPRASAPPSNQSSGNRSSSNRASSAQRSSQPRRGSSRPRNND